MNSPIPVTGAAGDGRRHPLFDLSRPFFSPLHAATDHFSGVVLYLSYGMLKPSPVLQLEPLPCPFAVFTVPRAVIVLSRHFCGKNISL